MSENAEVSRAQIASLLWSSIDRASGLARLRDVLHSLRQEFGETAGEILVLHRQTIAFRPGAVRVAPEDDNHPDIGAAFANNEFLVELEGIDPAFDRWLMHVRDTRRRNRGHDKADVLFPENSDKLHRAHRGLAIVVTGIGVGNEQLAQEVVRALSDEIGSALTRMRWFTVIEQSSDDRPLSFTESEIAKIADYGLVGFLQKDGGLYRLSVKLMDLDRHGAIVWAMVFEHEGELGFHGLEKLAASVAASLEAELLLIDSAKDRSQAAIPIDKAYALLLQAVPSIYRLERENFMGAGYILEQAIAADQTSALAHSWLALWHLFCVGQGWTVHRLKSLKAAGKVAERAMLLDPKDARGFAICGHVKAYLGRKLDEAAALHEQALEINPALPLAWHFSGLAHAYAGQHQEALRRILRCSELAPRDPHAFFADGALCVVHVLRREHDEAAVLGRRVTERHPYFTSAHRAFLAALGHLGRLNEAASVLQRLLALDPTFSLRQFRMNAPFQRPEDLEHFVAGLRLAGVV